MITAYLGSAFFFFIMILYIGSVAGLPLGDFIMGGKYKILPKNYRIICAASVLVQAFAILVLLQLGDIFSIGIPPGIAKGAGYFFALYLAVNIYMNFRSKSKKEKLIMTPLSALIMICFLITTILS